MFLAEKYGSELLRQNRYQFTAKKSMTPSGVLAAEEKTAE
jgi:hypothetical protein